MFIDRHVCYNDYCQQSYAENSTKCNQIIESRGDVNVKIFENSVHFIKRVFFVFHTYVPLRFSFLDRL